MAFPRYGIVLRTSKKNAGPLTDSKRDRRRSSSPLIILAKLGCFDSLKRVFPCVYISPEVHSEIVTAGAGLPGALEVSDAEWIEVKAVQSPGGVSSAQRKYGLGPGEVSTILLAKELGANPVLLDDYKARTLAKAESLEILGSVGLLEIFHLRHYLTDLRSVFRQLLMHNVYIDRRLLDRRLHVLGLPPL
jgi:predicted nucleic acid-binding protein